MSSEPSNPPFDPTVADVIAAAMGVVLTHPSSNEPAVRLLADAIERMPDEIHVALIKHMNGRATETLKDVAPTWRGIEDLCETAWTIIANAPGWDTDTDWRQAAIRWRERWHSYLDWAKHE